MYNLPTDTYAHGKEELPYEKAEGKSRHQVHGKEYENEESITKDKHSNLQCQNEN